MVNQNQSEMETLETARNTELKMKKKKMGAEVFVYRRHFASGAPRNVEGGSSIGYCYLLNSFWKQIPKTKNKRRTWFSGAFCCLGIDKVRCLWVVKFVTQNSLWNRIFLRWKGLCLRSAVIRCIYICILLFKGISHVPNFFLV